MGLDGGHVLGHCIDQDNGKASLGQLSTQHPTHRASPTYHQAHRRPHAQVMHQYRSALDVPEGFLLLPPWRGKVGMGGKARYVAPPALTPTLALPRRGGGDMRE